MIAPTTWDFQLFDMLSEPNSNNHVPTLSANRAQLLKPITKTKAFIVQDIRVIVGDLLFIILGFDYSTCTLLLDMVICMTVK